MPRRYRVMVGGEPDEFGPTYDRKNALEEAAHNREQGMTSHAVPVREARHPDGSFKAMPHFRVVNRMTGAFREGSFDTKAEAREAARAQNRTFGAGWVVEREG